jgi:hypothetical protein
VGADRAAPAGDGEHQATDDEERHHHEEHRDGHVAEGDQHVHDVVDERRGLLTGMEQVAAERAAGERRRRRRRVGDDCADGFMHLLQGQTRGSS